MDISFESFADLILKLGNPPKSKTKFLPDGTGVPFSPHKIFLSWIQHQKRPFPPHTGKRIFRLLFPHEGNRRRYGLKETLLAEQLQVALGLDGLTKWDSVAFNGTDGGQGCLGNVVEHALKKRCCATTRSSLAIGDVDRLLDELAAPSFYSQMSQIPSQHASPHNIIKRCFRDSSLSPFATSVLIQIILRDLRPLLCPLPHTAIRHPTSLLRVKTTAAPEQLGAHTAMWCWDPVMAELYRDGKGNIDFCADMAESIALLNTRVLPDGPIVGVNVQIPKCRKGRSITDALKPFFEASGPRTPELYAEVKYDGYRLQIHVDMRSHHPVITTFSKSKRKSTVERGNAHALILATLGLPFQSLSAHPFLADRAGGVGRSRRQMKSSIILEAEVVPFNESEREGGRGPGIEEFWWLEAAGVNVDSTRRGKAGPRHLCLAFFDILHLDGESLLNQPYERRRELLEQTVRPIHGFTMLAERSVIPLDSGESAATLALRAAFQRCVRAREEGLVLKAASSKYIDSKLPWVKLKKDYIPNLGDCVDLVVLGAGWDIDRARKLRVDTSVFTSFYIGTLINAAAVLTQRTLPMFEILFRVSYGLSRDQLEIYNENLRLARWRTKPFDKDDPYKRRLLGFTWRFNLRKSIPPPSVLFEQPLCAEVMGAGFQRLPTTTLYELRWPRMVKIFDNNERPWTQALSADKLRDAAHLSLGYSTTYQPPPSSPEDDSLRAMWRSKSNNTTTDIPDLSLSPQQRVPLTPRRCASAPGVLKMSPPTPVHRSSARGGAGAKGKHAEPASPLGDRSSAGANPKLPGLTSPLVRCPASQLLFQVMGSGNKAPPSPISSPAARLRPAPEFTAQPPAKRVKVDAAALPTPPVSSSPTRGGAAPSASASQAALPRLSLSLSCSSPHRPLSLRSRVKLAKRRTSLPVHTPTL